MANKTQGLSHQFICCLLILIMTILSCGKSKKIVDKTAPSNPSITINSYAVSTTSTTVTLSLSASDDVGVTGYCASESSTTPSDSDSCWTSVTLTASYSSSVSFTLSGGRVGDNTKTAYVWFRDSAGNVSSSANDNITLTVSDKITPSKKSVSISSGAALTTSISAMLKLPDTGQTGDYTTIVGEDSDYTINPPSYTDNGNGTITDNVTGLTWQKEDDNIERVWDNANTYCDDLALGGYSDWRLPSDMELMSIVNYGVYNPAINTTYFPDTNSSFYWLSDTIASDSSAYALHMDFTHGFIINYVSKSNRYYVRCVRGDITVMGKFTDNANGTVTNNNTGLMWQKEDDDTARQWESAITYCEGLSLGNYTDWRLPNIKELLSITDDTKYNPAIDTTYFPNTNLSYYWSSTTDAGNPTDAWLVYFGDSNSNESGSYYVRCVRGGQ